MGKKKGQKGRERTDRPGPDHRKRKKKKPVGKTEKKGMPAHHSKRGGRKKGLLPQKEGSLHQGGKGGKALLGQE